TPCGYVSGSRTWTSSGPTSSGRSRARAQSRGEPVAERQGPALPVCDLVVVFAEHVLQLFDGLLVRRLLACLHVGPQLQEEPIGSAEEPGRILCVAPGRPDLADALEAVGDHLAVAKLRGSAKRLLEPLGRCGVAPQEHRDSSEVEERDHELLVAPGGTAQLDRLLVEPRGFVQASEAHQADAEVRGHGPELVLEPESTKQLGALPGEGNRPPAGPFELERARDIAGAPADARVVAELLPDLEPFLPRLPGRRIVATPLRQRTGSLQRSRAAACRLEPLVGEGALQPAAPLVEVTPNAPEQLEETGELEHQLGRGLTPSNTRATERRA